MHEVSTEGARARTSPQGWIPEAQGLRTIALILVATFHIWFGRVSGGVDIFLFIGAYLMTRSLIARAEGGGYTRPISFIIRKFARLMPSAIAAIALTIAAVLILTSPRSWGSLFDQALAAGTYWMNLWLQGEAVNYWATDRFESSFFQHFWSLSIQGQVFVIWPFLHLAGEAIARLVRISSRTFLIGVFAVITVVSFGWALHTTSVTPDLAYFDLIARLWEFALGSLLALVVPWLKFPLVARRIMTAVGLVGAILCGFIMPVGAAYPGLPALWPIVCAILVLAAADSRKAPADRPDPVLGSRVLQTLGGYTYALYLTHWPVLILFANLTGRNVPGPLGGLALLAISALAAVGIVWLVERPVAAWLRRERPRTRRWAPRVGVRTVATLAVFGAVAAALPVGGAQAISAASEAARDEIWDVDVSTRGPQAAPAAQLGPLVPAPLVSRQHIDQNGERCAEDDPWASPICVESGSRDAERSIVVIGSSHAMAYWGMAWETVNETGMDAHIRSYGSPGCLYFGVNPAGESACAAMWHTAFDYVTETKPDLVIVLGTVSQPDGPDDLYDGSLSESFGFNLADIGPTIDLARSTGETDIVVIRDVPRQPEPPADCAEQHGFEADQCVYPLNPPPAELDEFSESVVNAGAVWVDLQDVICPDGECRPSMGGIATYVDSHHITATMSRSLAQVFADQVHPSIPWWPSRVWDAA